MTFTPPPTHLSRPTLTGSFGMTASTHWASTAVAQGVLERGGNAFDAVVAAGFVMHIVEPHLNGPGGDLVAIVAPADSDPTVIVGQGPAPKAATIEAYRSLGLDSVPGSGALAAAVPGAVEGWLWMLREYGTWDVADVFEYAIYYAEHGHPLVPGAAAAIDTMSDHFQNHWPSSAATWLIGGVPPTAGTVVGNPVYGRTMRRLVAAAGTGGRIARIDAVRDEWKCGFVAKAIADAAARPHRHADGGDYAGVISANDLSELQIVGEIPATLEFRGHTIVKASFWSQGPVLLQTLAILDHFDDADLDPSTERGAHTILEALKLAMADRDSYYGDNRVDVAALQELLDPGYAKARAAQITDRASNQFCPGTIAGCNASPPPLRPPDGTAFGGSTAGVGEPTVSKQGAVRGDTVHLDVVDRWGNMVSATPSGGWLQSNPTIPELGFCLGSRLQMTWLDADSPSGLAPGRRPRTTLTPTVLLRDGVAVAALGSPGGDQQDQWQLLYLLRTIVGGYTLQEAIDAPMFHTTALVESFWPRHWTPLGAVVEERLGADVIAGLRRRGHDVTVAGPWSLGRMSAVARDPHTGVLSAAANPRGHQGYAAGR